MPPLDPDLLDREEADALDRLAELEAEHTNMLLTLARIRREAGLTVEDVADRMGITPEGVLELENPDADPYMSTLRRYALCIGALISYTATAFDDED